MPQGDGGSCGDGRKGTYDDIHFRNEERKKKVVWVRSGERWEEKHQQQRGRGEKCFARCNQSRRRRAAFLLRLAALTDGCVHVCVFMCILSQRTSVSVSPGCQRTWEKALVARKKQFAVLAIAQLPPRRVAHVTK